MNLGAARGVGVRERGERGRERTDGWQVIRRWFVGGSRVSSGGWYV